MKQKNITQIIIASSPFHRMLHRKVFQSLMQTFSTSWRFVNEIFYFVYFNTHVVRKKTLNRPIPAHTFTLFIAAVNNREHDSNMDNMWCILKSRLKTPSLQLETFKQLIQPISALLPKLCIFHS